MKIGTIHTMHWRQPRTQEQVYRECIERMVLADKLGYWSSWTTEHHFMTDPAYLPYGDPDARFDAYDLASDPLTFLTYVAARTERLRLGTGVLVPLYDNPIRTAERAAMLDVLSGGRLELGIGRGSSGVREPAAFHTPEGDANRRKYHEALDIMQRAWTGEPFSYRGEFFDVPEVAVVPKPLQNPIPLYLGSSSQESLARIARDGQAYCSVAGAWGPVGLERHAATRSFFLQEAKAAGHDVSRLLFPHVLLLYCAETDAEAEAVAREYIRRYVYVIEAHYERKRHGGGTIGGLQNDAAIADIDAMATAMIGLNIIGSPESCARKLAAFQEVAGLNYLLGLVDFGGIPHQLVLDSIERFGRKVLPEFADHALPEAAG